MKLPKSGIDNVVDSYLENKMRSERPREYLGFSEIGEECIRKLWYGFNDRINKVDARLSRIFETGNMYERYIIRILREANLKVYDKDENGKQFRSEFFDGKFAGHCDGVITGLPESSKPHVLEIKSANNKNFNEIKKNGIETAKYGYYCQVQMYMGALKLDNALIIVINKDNQEMYYSRIKFNKFTFEHLKDKAREVIESKTIPKKEYKDGFYKCNWCEYRKRCDNQNEQETR